MNASPEPDPNRNFASPNTLLLCIIVGLIALQPLSAKAQGFQWPEEPQNLQVLPPDTKGARLGQIMRGFATALGVRCQFCHVGEGDDLTTFDFPSDEKLTKRKARVMIEMVRSINENLTSKLSALDEPGTSRVRVTCMTCHRTQSKPVMLEDILAAKISDDGLDAAIQEYHELRDEHYGGFAYNFGPETLTGLGERLAGEGNYEAAIAMLNLEIEVNGESPSIYFTLGGVHARAGRRDEAIASYRKGLAIAPDGWKPFFEQQINRLQNQRP